MGAVLAAVSPAVVAIFRMAKMMEEGVGTERSVPNSLWQGFLRRYFRHRPLTSFLGMAKGGDLKLASLLDVPLSVICGMI